MPSTVRAPSRASTDQRRQAVQVRELTILNAIAEALNSAPDVEQALTRTLALVTDLLRLRTGWVWLLDRETQQMYIAAEHNLPPFLRRPVQMVGDTCTCIADFRSGELTPKNIDVLECSRLRRSIAARAEAETEGLRYHASVPLYFQEQPLGIMNLTGPSWRKLTLRELRLLSTIAYQVGIAVERARLAGESARLARAEERTRLARELHDTLAQELTAIGLHLEGAMRHLEGNPLLARERLARALATTRESLEEARRSVLNLRATPLAGKSLADALGALSRSFTSETGVRLHLRVLAPKKCVLPLRMEGELFRIAQEALANVRQHAHATRVEITLRVGARRVSLAVEDDGRGFTVPRATSHAGEAATEQHGLLGMRERAKLLGGALRLRSAPGAGTRVVVSAPLAPAAATGG